MGLKRDLNVSVNKNMEKREGGGMLEIWIKLRKHLVILQGMNLLRVFFWKKTNEALSN